MVPYCMDPANFLQGMDSMVKYFKHKPSRFGGFDIFDDNDGEPFKVGHMASEDDAMMVCAAYEMHHALVRLMESIVDVTEGELIAWSDIVEAEDISIEAIAKAIIGHD